jgi:uncharacterized RDD family membrane protein YckC
MLQHSESQPSSDTRSERRGVQLHVEPERASLEVTPGKFAVLRVRLSVEGTPRPIKGHPSVRVVDDPAYEIAGVTEKRRTERTIDFEVHGRFRDTHARDIKLAYEVDGLRADQVVTFVPMQPKMVSSPRTAPSVEARHTQAHTVPFTTPRDPLSHATFAAAPAPMRLIAAIIDLVIAAVLATASTFVMMVVLALTYTPFCGTDPVPGSACAVVEDSIITALVVWWFLVAIPAYQVVTSIVGRSLGKRWLGLRVVRVQSREHPRANPNTRLRSPGFWRGLVRVAVAYLGAAFIGVGYLWMFLNRDRRAWHDLASGTIVVRATPSSESASRVPAQAA